MKFCCFNTALGTAGLIVGSHGVTRIFLPPVSRADIVAQAPAGAKEINPADCTFAQAIVRYFEGDPEPFDFPIDLTPATPFQQRVYHAVRRIGYAQRQTYGEVARTIGASGAARGVGAAMAANPVPLAVPCHRVVAAGGRLGGFSGPGGIGQKELLLRMEQEQSVK